MPAAFLRTSLYCEHTDTSLPLAALSAPTPMTCLPCSRSFATGGMKSLSPNTGRTRVDTGVDEQSFHSVDGVVDDEQRLEWGLWGVVVGIVLVAAAEIALAVLLKG